MWQKNVIQHWSDRNVWTEWIDNNFFVFQSYFKFLDSYVWKGFSKVFRIKIIKLSQDYSSKKILKLHKYTWTNPFLFFTPLTQFCWKLCWCGYEKIVEFKVTTADGSWIFISTFTFEYTSEMKFIFFKC